MHPSTILTLFLATLASSAALTTPVADDAVEVRFPNTVLTFEGTADIVGRSNDLVARACNCGSKFSCTKSVTECCKNTGGYGMCNRDTKQCKCGTQCNPLQCKW